MLDPAEVEALAAYPWALEALNSHQKVHCNEHQRAECRADACKYPCPTVRAIKLAAGALVVLRRMNERGEAWLADYSPSSDARGLFAETLKEVHAFLRSEREAE